MAKMMDEKSTTYKGEAKTYDCFEKNLSDHYVVYYNRQVNDREFDFLILTNDMCLFMVEVKGWLAKNIYNVVSPDEIYRVGQELPDRSPLKQARGYRFQLLEKFRKLRINPLIISMVCYPFISREEYLEKRLDVVSDESVTIFSEDLEDAGRLQKKLQDRYEIDRKIHHDPLTRSVYDLVRHYFEPTYDLKSEIEDFRPGYSRLYAFVNDLSDEKIAQIIQEYFKGIKEILFVNSHDDLDRVALQLQAEFALRNLTIIKGSISVGGPAPTFQIAKNEFRLFNFEAYILPQSHDFIREDLVIEEGECTPEQQGILAALSSLTTFNYQQYQVEHAPAESNILVSAGAGTGKTYSMMSRIAFLCNKSIDYVQDLTSEIAMITFTDNAANNMKDRLKRMFLNYFVLTSDQRYMHYIEDMNRIQISTFHGIGKKICQNECLRMGLGEDCQVSSETYRRSQLYDIYMNVYINKKLKADPDFVRKLDLPIHDYRDILVKLADQLYQRSYDIKDLKPENVGEPPTSAKYLHEMIFEVAIPAEKFYLEELTDNNRIDLRQYMIQVNKLLKISDVTLPEMNYRYLFIDEFQDTDDTQIETVLEMLKRFGPNARLFIVGDLKQSIYRFRGATLSAFEKVQAGSSNWKAYDLTRNYRTDGRLLKRFDATFRALADDDLLPYKNKDRLISNIEKEYADEEIVKCINIEESDDFYEKLFDEIKEQVQKLEALASRKPLSPEEKIIALLARRNREIADLVREGHNHGVEVEVETGGNLYQLASTIDLFKLTQALVQPENEVYLSNLIRSNYVHQTADFASLHSDSAEEKRQQLIQLLDDYFTELMGKSWSQLVVDFETRPVLVVLRDIYEETKPWIHYSRDDEQRLFYRENYECLIEKILQYYSRDYLTLTMVNEFLKINITTSQEEESRKSGLDSSRIRVVGMTVHKSKGLEFGTVVLPFTSNDMMKLVSNGISANIIDGQLVYSYSQQRGPAEYSGMFDEEVERTENAKEESRILYVAMTRAIRNFVWVNDKRESEDKEGCWSHYLEELE